MDKIFNLSIFSENVVLNQKLNSIVASRFPPNIDHASAAKLSRLMKKLIVPSFKHSNIPLLTCIPVFNPPVLNSYYQFVYCLVSATAAIEAYYLISRAAKMIQNAYQGTW